VISYLCKVKREVGNCGTSGDFVVLYNGLENRRYSFSDQETEDKAFMKAQQHVYALNKRQSIAARLNKSLAQ